MILTWIINRVKRWFNRIVNQAIIDGMQLHRDRCRGHRDMPDEVAKQQQAIFLLIGFEIWAGIIFVIAARAVG